MVCLVRCAAAVTVLVGCSLLLHAQLIRDPHSVDEELVGVTWPEVVSGGKGISGGEVSAVADRHRYEFVQRNRSFYVVKVGRL